MSLGLNCNMWAGRAQWKKAICAQISATNTSQKAERQKYTGKGRRINAEIMWLLATAYSLDKIEYHCRIDGFGLMNAQTRVSEERFLSFCKEITAQNRRLMMGTGSYPALLTAKALCPQPFPKQ